MIILMLYVNNNFATIKGNYGKRQVNNILHQLDATTYKVYHDLYISTENNRTTQVDHVVTSPYGVFVIETKDFNGWIYGNERNKYWTQVIYKRRKCYISIKQNVRNVIQIS